MQLVVFINFSMNCLLDCTCVGNHVLLAGKYVQLSYGIADMN